MKKDKTYWRETLECYAFCLGLLILFLAEIIIFGQLTGTDWIGIIKSSLNAY